MTAQTESPSAATKPHAAIARAPADAIGHEPTAITVVIEPRAGWRPIELSELWRYRDLLYFLAWRDIKVRYKQTVLGALWAIIQPVLTMVVFSIFFGRLGGLDQKVAGPYPIFAFAGLLPWTFFAAAVHQLALSLVTSGNLISKVYFPRLIVPLASVGSCLVDFAIAFGVMLVLMVAYRVPPSPHLLLLPLLLVLLVVAAVGVGTWLSALVVAYRDFRYVINFVVQIWMFASPVVYPLSIVDDRWLLVYALNPLVGIIGGFRSALLGEPMPWGALLVSSLVSLAALVAGAAYFRRVERRFADIV